MSNAMANILICVVTLVSWLAPHAASAGCDYNGDGRDDPTAYQAQPDGSWSWQSLTGGAPLTLNNFGSAGAIPAPGYYLGRGHPAIYGYIDVSFFWNITGGDSLNFGRSVAAYMPGRDLNGDGADDLAKFLNRCTFLNKRCGRRSVRGNFLINSTDGVHAFNLPLTTSTGLFGHGLDALFAADANGDGRDDICFASPTAKSPRKFEATCKDVLTQMVLDRRVLGKLYNTPLDLRPQSGPDYFVMYRARGGAGQTDIRLIPPEGASPASFSIPAIGVVMTGDWLGLGFEQVGVVQNGNLTFINPQDGAVGNMAFPAGTPVDCRNNFQGYRPQKILTSLNVCRVMGCKVARLQ